jgi:cytosine/adenosine deaminase-related metal-dependent hydrolase
LDALRCGTTTLIDHHASPSHIAGSLDDLERGIDAVGLRGVLCYESTDRHGTKDGLVGLEENRRYISSCGARADGRFAAMVGAHAAFTMSDELLAGCVRLAAETNTGVHIHVAEDPCDDEICRREHGAALVERLARSGIGDPKNSATAKSILAHCTHLSSDDAKRLSGAVGAIAHNPRSNMNNQVGYAPIGAIIRGGAAGNEPGPIQLGTDGIGSDMFAEIRHAWFKSRDGKAGISPEDVVSMLVRSARTAGTLLGRRLGSLAAGAAADIVVTDYIPAAPLTSENAAGHLIFAMDSQHVRDVLIGGKWTLRSREIVFIDERPARRRAAEVARRVWSRMPAS